jgi:hypothetical protein
MAATCTAETSRGRAHGPSAAALIMILIGAGCAQFENTPGPVGTHPQWKPKIYHFGRSAQGQPGGCSILTAKRHVNGRLHGGRSCHASIRAQHSQTWGTQDPFGGRIVQPVPSRALGGKSREIWHRACSAQCEASIHDHRHPSNAPRCCNR